MPTGKSRWAESEAEIAALKREKEDKKRAKAEKLKRAAEDAEAAQLRAEQLSAEPQQHAHANEERPLKRRRLSNSEPSESLNETSQPTLIPRRLPPSWRKSRHVDEYERLNHIEEGSYGWVSRAKTKATGEIVALKKLKMHNADSGFPIEALREIQVLQLARHRHIVDLKDVVVGDGIHNVFLVMEFVEHDLKTLLEDMREPFLQSEIKTIMLQILSAVECLHDNWIMHRDLKTSNILMNNRGEIKIADFGMARTFSEPPPPNLTQLVVTLWYRSPELLLGSEEYDTAVDMWSIGCILGELLKKEPIIQGKNEVDQLSKIFSLCGVPTEQSWPGWRRLKNARALRPSSNARNQSDGLLRGQFPFLSNSGSTFMASLLALDPKKRPSAAEASAHPYFSEGPRPKKAALFPTFPSRASGERRRKVSSPSAPQRGEVQHFGEQEFATLFSRAEAEEAGAGFSLRLA